MKIYHGYCNSYNQNEYLCEIWQGPSGTDEENELVLAGVNIEWQGNGNKIYDKKHSVRPSKCTVGWVMRNSTDKTAFEAFKDYAESTFALKVYKNGDLFWVGRILADQSTFDRKDPATGEDIVELTAVDVLSLIDGFDVDPTWFTIDDKRCAIIDLIVDLISVTELTDYWGGSDFFLNDGTHTVSAGQASAQRLMYNSVNKAAFVSNPDPFLSSERLRYVSCREALERILHTYTAFIAMSNGSYWILQVPQYANDDYPYIPYSKSKIILGAIGDNDFPYHTADTTSQRPKFETFPVKSFQPPVREVQVLVEKRFGTVEERLQAAATTSTFIGSLTGCRNSIPASTPLTSPGYPVKAYFELRFDAKVYSQYKYRVWYKIYATDGVTDYAYNPKTQTFVTFTSLGDYQDIDVSGWKHGENTAYILLDIPEPPLGYDSVIAECYLEEWLGKVMARPGSLYVDWSSPVITRKAFYGTVRITQAQQNTSPYNFEHPVYFRYTNGATGINSERPELESAFYSGKDNDVGGIQIYNGSDWIDPGTWTSGWDITPDGDISQMMAFTYAAIYWRYMPAYDLKLVDNGNYNFHQALVFDSQKYIPNGVKFNADLETWQGEFIGLQFDYATFTGSTEEDEKETKGPVDLLLLRVKQLQDEMGRMGDFIGRMPVKLLEHLINYGADSPSSDPGGDRAYGVQVRYNYDASNPSIEFGLAPAPLNGAGWVTVVKQETTTIDSDSSLNDDPELQIPMLQDYTYSVRGKIFYDTDPTADFKFGWSGVTGDIRISYKYIKPHDTTLTVQSDASLPTNVAATGTGDTGGFIEFDGVFTPDADGTLVFQWCQNTSDAASTSALKGSYVEYMEVPELPAVDVERLLEDGTERLLEDGTYRLVG